MIENEAFDGTQVVDESMIENEAFDGTQVVDESMIETEASNASEANVSALSSDDGASAIQADELAEFLSSVEDDLEDLSASMAPEAASPEPRDESDEGVSETDKDSTPHDEPESADILSADDLVVVEEAEGSGPPESPLVEDEEALLSSLSETVGNEQEGNRTGGRRRRRGRSRSRGRA